MLVNYFKLEDPMKELYEDDKKVKKEFIKKYIQEKNQEEDLHYVNGDFTNIGTEKFNVR